MKQLLHLIPEKPDLRNLKRELQETVLFKPLSSAELDDVINYAQLRQFKKGEHVFFQGDRGSALFVILKGEVEIERLTKGKIVPLARLSEGMFFGELALIYDTPRTATAVVTDDSLIVSLFKHDLDKLSKHYPALGDKMLSIIKVILEQRLAKPVKRK